MQVEIGMASEQPLVSVIIPIFNSEQHLEAALKSVLEQTYRSLEICMYDDGSRDSSPSMIRKWQEQFEAAGFCVKSKFADQQPSEKPPDGKFHPGHGPGYARNQAVAMSSGAYLCLLDSDDVMMPERVELQLAAALENPSAIVGCQFIRDPPESTERYTNWCNSLTPFQLISHRFQECTLIQPTWFFKRSVFEAIGGYPEDEHAEDLFFFYRHFENASNAIEKLLLKVERPLLMYRHAPQSVCSLVSKHRIRAIRVQFLEKQVLGTKPWCDGFGIWGAGKNGRQFYRELNDRNKQNVLAFYDIDERKIGQEYPDYRRGSRTVVRQIPIRHFSQIVPPFITCVSLDRTDGEFERNLAATGLREGIDYLYFS